MFQRLQLLLLTFLLSAPYIQAGKQGTAPLPVDPELRIGHLSNGMTYYIRHNEEPKGRAEFWLVQNTGSLVEEDDERGFAHFIEHIAFQGSRNFPDIDMVDILQSNGIAYGSEINASTGFDNTQFQISNVPTAKRELLDTVLMMLRDLSFELNFDDRAIEEERSVIQEEWRMQADQSMRMHENTLPILMSGSRYANRIAIGDMSVIRNLRRRQLLDFYHRWYTPDRQAVVVVGDFDAERMEHAIMEIMGTIPEGDGAASNQTYGIVPDHAGVNYALSTDPEASNSMVYLMFEHGQIPKSQRNTMAYLKHNVVSQLVQGLLAERLNEMARVNGSPVNYGTVYDRKFLVAGTRDALTLAALTKEGRTLEALDSLIVQAARALEHGFTATELERTKRNATAMFLNYQSEADKRTNREYADEYIDHFEYGGYVPGVLAESRMLIEEVQRTTLEDVNAYLSSVAGKDNVSVLISGPQSMTGKSMYPTSRDVIAHFGKIMNSPQTPYIDRVGGEQLLSELPKAGGIVNETYEPETGITTMTLRNGATVRLKPTTFRNNEILFNAISLGGEWAYGDTADVNVRLMDQVIEDCALGGHTIPELNKMLSGRQLGLSFILNDPNEQMSGGCNSQDLETLLQLNYLYFTDVSVQEQEFQAIKSRIKSQIKQASNNPKMIYSDSIGSTIYCGNPMYRNLTPEDVDQIDKERLLQLYRQRVANAGDYSFSIVGAFDIDEVRPLIKRYLASLPDNGVRETYNGYRPQMAAGMANNYFEVPMQNPRSTVYVSIMGDKKYSYDDEFMMDLVGETVGAALLTYLRHEKHGIYDVAADGALSIYHDRWMLNYEFGTSIADRDSMIEYADYAVNAVMCHGCSPDLFVKIKEQMAKQHDNALCSNSYWLRALQQRALGVDIIGGYERIFPTLTNDLLNNYIGALRPHTRLRIVMN